MCQRNSLHSCAVTIWSQNPTKQNRTPTTRRLKIVSHVLMGHFTFFSCFRDGNVTLIPLHHACCASPRTQPPAKIYLQDGGCSVLTWAERWGQDVLIYSPCHCDLQQQSNCCSDTKKNKKKKQSAAHPHTAGYSWTKEDYLQWYKKSVSCFWS